MNQVMNEGIVEYLSVRKLVFYSDGYRLVAMEELRLHWDDLSHLHLHSVIL